MDIGYKKDGKFYKLVVGKSRDKDLPDVYFVQLYAFNEEFTKRDMLLNAVVLIYYGRDRMETKAVIRFSTAYEKLDKIEKDVQEVKNWLHEDCIDKNANDHIEKLEKTLRMIDSHHGLLLYAKEKHGVDLDEIWDSYYINERGYKPEEILK